MSVISKTEAITDKVEFLLKHAISGCGVRAAWHVWESNLSAHDILLQERTALKIKITELLFQWVLQLTSSWNEIPQAEQKIQGSPQLEPFHSETWHWNFNLSIYFWGWLSWALYQEQKCNVGKPCPLEGMGSLLACSLSCKLRTQGGAPLRKGKMYEIATAHVVGLS